MKILFQKNINYKILIIATLLILPKWIYNFYLFPYEDIDLKIISNISDIYYLPIISNISEFVLNPLYSNDEIVSQGIFSFPILNFFIISFFYKFFGTSAFIILEVICTFLFFYIFFNIFLLLNFNNNQSFLMTLIFYLLPSILNTLSQFNIPFVENISLNFSTFYGSRFPRPILTNLFLFYYLLILMKIFIYKESTKKNFLIIGIVNGITLHSFFYFFIFQNFLLIFLIFKKNKENILNFVRKEKTKLYIYSSIVLIFFLLYYINISYADPDYGQRLGVVKLDINKKIILLEYFFNFLTNKIFILLFVLSIVFYFLVNKTNINFYFFFFISTIFSTLFFNLLSPLSIDIYHFYNWILTSSFFYILVCVFYFFFKKIIHFNLVKNYFLYSIILLSIIFYSFLNINNLSKINLELKDNRNKIINYIKNNKKSFNEKTILIFDHHLFIWLSINNYHNFNYVPDNMWTVRSNDTLEKDIINVFKFFNLNEKDFGNYILNQKSSFRMQNKNAMSFLGRKYLANKLYTFEGSKDFDDFDFINQIKPSIGHSFAIPNYEINRLTNKFKNTNLEISPDLLILNTDNNFIFNYNNLLNKKYCQIFNTRRFVILSKNYLKNVKCLN